MKELIIILFLLISNFTFSQIKAVIIDNHTDEKIPFVNVWIENENIGTTSNEQGGFEINDIVGNKLLIFSAIGYSTKKIHSDSIKSVIKLDHQITELKEVLISKKTISKELKIGSFNKKTIKSYFSCGTKPWIAARYFEHKEKYENTRYLKTISFLTRSDVKDSKFNVRLYAVNENGEPENYIYNKNILGIARKGKKLAKVDVSNLNIEFPKEGFFIAVEWLIIENNKYEHEYYREGSKEKLYGVSYEPSVGTFLSETDQNSWIFSQGKWRKVWKKKGITEKDYDNYNLLAIELILSN